MRLVRQLRSRDWAASTGRSSGSRRSWATGWSRCGLWVKQAEIDDGEAPGVTTAEAKRIKELEQEVRELRRANAILKSASAFFAAELDRPQK